MKKLIGILLMMVMMISIFAQVVRASSFNFIVTPSATTVKYGDTVRISLKVADIDAGELGINTVECMLQYDTEMFEDIKIESKNNWSITYNDRKDNQNYGKLLAVLVATGITEDQEIGAISFKVKKDTKLKSGNIKFTQVSTNDGQNVIPTSDKTITINIKEEPTNNNNNNNNNKNDNKVDVNTTIDIKDPTDKNQTSSKTTINSSNANMSNKPLPQTGDDLCIIAMCIVGMMAISISAYIEYTRCKKK